MEIYFESYWFVRLFFERSLAVVYLLAFITTLNQFVPLLGKDGFLPVPEFLKFTTFKNTPSVFHFYYSDKFVQIISMAGIFFSLILVCGFLDHAWLPIDMLVWFLLWAAYLSIVNVGQIFYAFGWESMLLEAGFFTIFLGNQTVAASAIPILILRWMLFRVELGAGLIKVRNDACWRNLTCLYYHYQTQPLPNPLSWFFHGLPKFFHKVSAIGSHFVQLIIPFFLFFPQPFASIAGALIILHQLWLVISGNYSWLNLITIVLGITAFSDSTLTIFFQAQSFQAASNPFWSAMQIVLVVFALFLSIKPALNLLSKRQIMNYSYNPFHLVNSYGAFGTVTKERYEIVLEATDELIVTPSTKWEEYEFKAKPTKLSKMPPQIAPYHLKLDWLMWFLPFSVIVTPSGMINPGHELWFLRFVLKLLDADKKTLKLLKHAPFKDHKPTFVRALFYHYQFSTLKEKKETGIWWKRRLAGEFLPPLSFEKLSKILNSYGF